MIELARAGGCEVENDSLVRIERLVVHLVGARVVQNNVNLQLGRMMGDHLIRESLDFSSFFTSCGTCYG